MVGSVEQYGASEVFVVCAFLVCVFGAQLIPSPPFPFRMVYVLLFVPMWSAARYVSHVDVMFMVDFAAI